MRNLKSCFALLLLFVQPAFANDGGEGPTTLKERCVATLREGMWDGTNWVKVHAGESLARLDYLDGVYEYLKHELAAHSKEPGYRAGVWRVLAQAATHESDRDQWMAKLRAAAMDPKGADRDQAIEALARLAAKLTAREEEAFIDLAEGGNADTAVPSRWALANSGRTAEIEALAGMLTNVQWTVRAKAATALRALPRLSPEIFEKLTEALFKERPVGESRVYLVTAAFVHAPTREKQRFKPELLSFLRSKRTTERYEACVGLAKGSTAKDASALVPLLDDPEIDVRVSAADAILRLTRRSSIHLYSGKITGAE